MFKFKANQKETKVNLHKLKLFQFKFLKLFG